ncbi:MAG: DNA-binding protein [Acaryochloris sp. CRU_2_0]|nr:DNA-binding protein [Acaryochloris sp. CRU_2_0]
MKKLTVWILSIASLGILFSTPALTQPGMMRGRGSKGWGSTDAYCRMYNTKAIEILSGEIVSIDKFTPMPGMSYGIHLTLKTAKEDISVHLGPGWYIEGQDIRLQLKDRIEVKGSMVTFAGKPVIMATQVKKGNDVLTLRDGNGLPAWSGWRHRSFW